MFLSGDIPRRLELSTWGPNLSMTPLLFLAVLAAASVNALCTRRIEPKNKQINRNTTAAEIIGEIFSKSNIT